LDSHMSSHVRTCNVTCLSDRTCAEAPKLNARSSSVDVEDGNCTSASHSQPGNRVNDGANQLNSGRLVHTKMCPLMQQIPLSFGLDIVLSAISMAEPCHCIPTVACWPLDLDSIRLCKVLQNHLHIHY